MRHKRLALAFASALVLLTGILVLGQDRKVVDPSMKILLENDRVRVQEHYLKPGEKIGMHSHPDKVI